VLKHDPQNVDAHIGLGKLHLGLNNRPEAALQFGLAIRLEPHNPWAYLGLATSQRGHGEVAEAVRTLESGLRAVPGNVSLLNLLARILATTPDDDVRDGARALALALQANESTDFKDCLTLDTLAAAYAEVGDFTKATATSETAAHAAETLGYEHTARIIRETAGRYRDGLTLRESSTNLALR
jgi:cytochrome c-type biogenesis protein CcmH/NrfG